MHKVFVCQYQFDEGRKLVCWSFRVLQRPWVMCRSSTATQGKTSASPAATPQTRLRHNEKLYLLLVSLSCKQTTFMDKRFTKVMIYGLGNSHCVSASFFCSPPLFAIWCECSCEYRLFPQLVANQGLHSSEMIPDLVPLLSSVLENPWCSSCYLLAVSSWFIPWKGKFYLRFPQLFSSNLKWILPTNHHFTD